ncbi:MAG: type I phosphomannose isomerase catalytic subunit [Isosphaeraceae bacterium]
MGPLVFEPYLRPMIWGGRRLGERFGKSLPDAGPYGESWEVSAHPHHVSRVAEGPLKGATLTDLTASHPQELFGARVPADGAFPLLVKLLDCHELLSIQVHPDDERARRLTHGRERFGKTEAWVVLEVGPEGKIYSGFKPGVTAQEVERRLASGTLEHCLHSYTPKPGDCVFLKAGTVHAVGHGVVMAEVQQSSDATFRLHDWDRPGPDGLPRALHISESLESIDWNAGPVNPVPGAPLSGLPESVYGERLVTAEPFLLDRYQTSVRFAIPDDGRTTIWLVLDGEGELASQGGGEPYRRAFQAGETVLIPATRGPLAWVPSTAGLLTLLRATLP